MPEIRLDETTLYAKVEDGTLTSVGVPRVGGCALRADQPSCLPWFDTYDGVIFDRFRFLRVDHDERRVIIRTSAVGRQDHPFRERRDTSGDLCLRDLPWDAPSVEAELDICLEPATCTVEGHTFKGYRYWFEVRSPQVKIHRLLDRQAFAPGGSLSDEKIICRNWLTPPVCPIGVNDAYSTVGLEKWSQLMPGNLWARWSLLPGFDLLHGSRGILVGRYDRVSCVRTVIEKQPGEASLRISDLHNFERSHAFSTNPKTILFSGDTLDETAAVNLWTRLTDADRDMSCRQFGIVEGPPEIQFTKNKWTDFNYRTTYNDVLEIASEFGAERIFVDPPWEHFEAFWQEMKALIPDARRRDASLLSKLFPQHMCCTIDFKAAEILGGEAAIKDLCDRAAAKGVKVMSWIATHITPMSVLRANPRDLGHGTFGVLAAKESGYHPDTGYPGDCWPLNLNAPVFNYVRDQILGLCRRTGLSGFLWDSFSNLGWWQVDYSDGSMRPQFDKMAQLYADMTNAGLYIMPEGLAAFSNHSCLGLMGEDVYEGSMLPYSYNTAIAFHGTGGGEFDPEDNRILRGELPIDVLFRCFAHKRIPATQLWSTPREKWDPRAVEEIRRLYRTYRKIRPQMQHRSVLANDVGVRWRAADGSEVLWCFKPTALGPGSCDALSGEPVSGTSLPNHVYQLRRDDRAV